LEIVIELTELQVTIIAPCKQRCCDVTTHRGDLLSWKCTEKNSFSSSSG